MFVEGAQYAYLDPKNNAYIYSWDKTKISFKLNSDDLDIIISALKSNVPFKIEKNNKVFQSTHANVFCLHDTNNNLSVLCELTQEHIVGFEILLTSAKTKIFNWS